MPKSPSKPPKVLIPLSPTGHDPTEVAIPYTVFLAAGLTIHFATPHGEPFTCDQRMLVGLTGALLGATTAAKKAYYAMIASEYDTPGSVRKPLAWTDAGFSMLEYDMVFLPGGHEKGVRVLIESPEIKRGLVKFFPLTKRDSATRTDREPEGGKVLAAICHGVQVLSSTPSSDPLLASSGKSIIHACRTTALPSFMETSVTWLTWLFLGDYYRTYGHSAPTVQELVSRSLDEPGLFESGPGPLSGRAGSPFVVVDGGWRYVSARFPPDAEEMAKKAVEKGRRVWVEW